MGVEGARLEQLTIPNLQISVSFILCFTKQKNVECDGALEGKQGKSLREWRSAKTACLEMSIPAWKGKKKINADCCAGKLMDYLNKAFASLNKTRGGMVVSS